MPTWAGLLPEFAGDVKQVEAPHKGFVEVWYDEVGAHGVTRPYLAELRLECLADVPPDDALRFDRIFQPLHRFAHTFASEGKRLEMNRQQVPHAGIVGHLNRLFRGAMRTEP